MLQGWRPAQHWPRQRMDKRKLPTLPVAGCSISRGSQNYAPIPRRIALDRWGSRDPPPGLPSSWVSSGLLLPQVSAPPTESGEMHRYIQFLPRPECALIVIAPRPKAVAVLVYPDAQLLRACGEAAAGLLLGFYCHQCRGRCTGVSSSSPGPSVRSSSSRPGPKAVAVPVHLDAQLSRACGEAAGY